MQLFHVQLLDAWLLPMLLSGIGLSLKETQHNKEEICLMAGMGPVLSYHSNSESIHVNLERDPNALPSIFAKLKQFINPKVKINYKENKDISNIPGSNAFEKLESLAKEDELTILHRCVTAHSPL